MLIEESYEKRAQQPFSARFATGDPGYGDLSFWQFINQQSWAGGAGQKIFSTTSKYRESTGWSMLTGKPRLCGGNTAVTGLSAFTKPVMQDNDGTNTFAYMPHSLLVFGKANIKGQGIILVGPNAFLCDGTVTSLRTVTSALVGIRHINARCAAIWQRVGPGTFGTGSDTSNYLIAAIYDAGLPGWRIIVYDAYFNVVGNNGLVSGGMRPNCIIPLTADKYLAICYNTAGNKPLQFMRHEWTANAWTAVTSPMGHSGNFPFTVSPHWAMDSSAAIYFVGISDTPDASSEHFQSAVGIMTATDALNSSGALLSEKVVYNDHYLTGAVSVNGTVYLIGARIIRNGSGTLYKPTVLKFPNTTVWESTESSATLTDVLPLGISQVSRSEAMFVSAKKGSGRYQSIMRVGPNDVVEEIFSVKERDNTTDRHITALARVGRSLYAYDQSQSVFYQADNDPANPAGTTSNTRTLLTSEYGGNTPLITKTLYKINVSLSEAMPASQTMTVIVNGTTAGTIVTADGTEKSITLATEITATDFEVTFSVPGTSTWQGEIEQLTLQYVPTQFKKRAWGFGIRATKRIKFGDGSHESRTPTTMFADIEASWASNIPVTFIDVDGVSYSVLVTDFKQKRPLLQMDRLSEQESFFFLELLQI